MRVTTAGAKSGPRAMIAALCDAAVTDGTCSAIAVGVVAPGGQRFVHFAGSTRRFVQVAGALQQVAAPAIDREAVFDLASLTKPMATTTLVWLRLADGRWRLDQSLRDMLPKVRGRAPVDATIGQLLCHSAGLPAWQNFYAAALAAPPAARANLVRRLVASTPPIAAPGAQAVYSDLGFMLLGWALEQDANRPLDELFMSEVAGPLGLRAARFRRVSEATPVADDRDSAGTLVCATEIWPARCSDGRPLQGMVHDDNCFALDGVAGHAGLFAPIDDVLDWAQAVLAAARDEPSILAAETLETILAQRARAETTWRGGFDTASPAGSSAGEPPPDGVFGHLGFTGTSVWIAPAIGAAVILTNRVHPSRDDPSAIKHLRPRLHDACWTLLRGV